MPAAVTIEDMRQTYAESGSVPSSDVELEIAAMMANEGIDSEYERARQFLCGPGKSQPEGVLKNAEFLSTGHTAEH